MKFKRFLTQFARVQPAEPEETTIRFAIRDREFLTVSSVEFDVAANTWTVQLAQASG